MPPTKLDLFNRWAQTYDWLFPSVFYQAIHQRMLAYIDSPPVKALDMGCGTGRLLDRLADAFPTMQGIGMDFSAEMLEKARERCQRHRPRLVFVRGDANQPLRFADAHFDAVFCTLSFLHYRHPDRVCAEVRRVLGSRGRFYFVDPVPFTATIRYAGITPEGIRTYSPETRERLGRAAGLTCQGHFYLLPSIVLTIFAPL